MKLDIKTFNDVEIKSSNGIGNTTNMTLSEDATQMVFQMFTKNVYSDPVGSLIREVASNCFDAIAEAKVNPIKNPAILELKKEDSGTYLSFMDKGIGMSPNRINNIYGIYFNSTKRDTNNQIGGFGIGGKTPLAYTDSFFVTTVSTKELEIKYCKNELQILKESNKIEDEEISEKIKYFEERLLSAKNYTLPKIKYMYCIYKGIESPSIELMFLQQCNEQNGTEIKVPIKEKDIYEFENKIERQLFYFENIVYKGFSDRIINNDYTIYKGKHFLYRGDSYSSYMHVCLGKVAYPIDYAVLDVDENDYTIPVALKFDIGEINVTVSRESLDYSEETKKLLIKKLELVKSELIEMLREQYKNVKTLEDYYDVTENFGYLRFDDNNKIYLGKGIKRSDISFNNFKYNKLKIPKQDEILGLFAKIKLYGKKPGLITWKDPSWNKQLNTMERYENIYFVENDFNRVVLKQAYLKSLHSSSNRFYIVSPKNISNSDDMEKLMLRLGCKEKLNPLGISSIKNIIPEKTAIKLINSLKKDVLKKVFKLSKNYEKLIVPQDFIDNRKKKRLNKNILNETFPIKIMGSYDGFSKKVKLNELKNFSGRIFYGTIEDEKQLRKAHQFARSVIIDPNGRSIHGHSLVPSSKYFPNKGLIFIRISKANIKYMKLLNRNVQPINRFYLIIGKRYANKIVSTLKMNKFKISFANKVLKIFKRNDMKFVNKDIFDKVKKVQKGFQGNNSDSNFNIDYYKNEINNYLKIDIDKEINNATFEYQQELDYLIEISNKNSKRLQWFSIPNNEIDPTCDSDKELIDLLNVAIDL